jgi:hypothetical protein
MSSMRNTRLCADPWYQKQQSRTRAPEIEALLVIAQIQAESTLLRKHIHHQLARIQPDREDK